MNNRGVVADRISQLPEALILQILCLLPTKIAITTSVLSKKWQSHWKKMPKLKFDSFLHRLDLENVCKSLLSHKAPVLHNFRLKVRLDGRNNAVDIGILIGIAMTRNVRKLVLEVYFHRGSFAFSRSLYNCETLETLKLILNVVMDVPSSVSLKSLRTLHLLAVDFKDDDSVINFLSGCPNLQDLVNITDVSEIIDEKLLVFLTSVKRLSLALTPTVFKFPTGIIFNQLVYLELYTNKKSWWKLLPLMLHSSPKLQVLKLINNLDGMNFVEASGEWNQPKNVPECLLFHLETCGKATNGNEKRR
ncbi:Leucine-rich repeat 2 [Arabidopsis thaliana x Arabidopsis arenosa]|uniref:Leucine-rich repeat 2 n=1 Tax=Arabidopsis thaliana x Arabidopsis arenosa TaxID=1240361 RepID=A0A8T2BE26_9BRAS|nr:Leucine-rich repeat 2 [Arabidopsis thaliana x Arabidopsis arenosa]